MVCLLLLQSTTSSTIENEPMWWGSRACVVQGTHWELQSSSHSTTKTRNPNSNYMEELPRQSLRKINKCPIGAMEKFLTWFVFTEIQIHSETSLHVRWRQLPSKGQEATRVDERKSEKSSYSCSLMGVWNGASALESICVV